MPSTPMHAAPRRTLALAALSLAALAGACSSNGGASGRDTADAAANSTTAGTAAGSVGASTGASTGAMGGGMTAADSTAARRDSAAGAANEKGSSGAPAPRRP